MRIADVSPRVVHPPVRGSSVRTSNLLLGLSRFHEVRQLSQARLGSGDPEAGRGRVSVNPSYREDRVAPRLPTLATELGARSWISAPVLAGAGLARCRALQDLLAWAQVAIVEFPWQFAACRRARPDLPMVLATHNVEAAKFADYAVAAGHPPGTGLWLRAIQRVERRAVRAADLVLAVSDDDRGQLVGRYGVSGDRVVTVPNGADTDRYVPASAETRAAARSRLGLPDRPTVLFAGADVPPNRAGLEWVERLAAEIEDVTFLVTGSVAEPGRNGIFATGLIDDFALALAAADLSICPIEYGGGTKIKLLESMAAGLPTVAFAESVAGLDIDDEVLVVPKSGRGLAEGIGDLLGSPRRRAELSERARSWVVANHDWTSIAGRLAEQLAGLSSQSGSRARG